MHGDVGAAIVLNAWGSSTHTPRQTPRASLSHSLSLSSDPAVVATVRIQTRAGPVGKGKRYMETSTRHWILVWETGVGHWELEPGTLCTHVDSKAGGVEGWYLRVGGK